jgi:hypothetical protein
MTITMQHSPWQTDDYGQFDDDFSTDGVEGQHHPRGSLGQLIARSTSAPPPTSSQEAETKLSPREDSFVGSVSHCGTGLTPLRIQIRCEAALLLYDRTKIFCNMLRSFIHLVVSSHLPSVPVDSFALFFSDRTSWIMSLAPMLI